jgi:ubiquinone/menaquinone biosynthesis C-methylase UbiE
MEDPFADVAADYDKMFPRDLAEDSRMLIQLFEGLGVKTVLDCACGTGLHVAMLDRRGFEVTGSDASGTMLEKAAARLRGQDADAPLVQAEWASLPDTIGERFDAVICIGNSLPLAGDDDDVFRAVAGMYEMVSPGGILAIQNRNMDKMRRERPDAILNNAQDGYTLFAFEYLQERVVYKIFYLVTGGPGKGDVTYSEFVMNVLTRTKFDRMLDRLSPLPGRKYYGDSLLSRFSPATSPRMIARVNKPGR